MNPCGNTTSKIKCLSMEDLCKLKEPKDRWLVDRLLTRGGFSLFAGKPKAGKSTSCKTLVKALINGTEFLGRSCVKGSVIYIAREEDPFEFRRQMIKLGIRNKDLLFTYFDPPPYGNDAFLALEYIIDAHSPKIVIIDTIWKWAPCSDLNDYQKVNETLVPLVDLAKRMNTHIMGVCHAKKGSKNDTESVLGSTAITGAADMVLVQSVQNGKRSISATPRYGDGIEETLLITDLNTLEISLGGSKKEADMIYAANAIASFLDSNSGEVYSKKELKENLEIRNQDFNRGLNYGHKIGQFQRKGAGKRGDPHVYFSNAPISIIPSTNKNGNQNSTYKSSSLNTLNSRELEKACSSEAGDL